MPAKYENWTASDAIDKSLHDNDIHYLSGDIANDNVSQTIKWIVSANLNKKPKKTRGSSQFCHRRQTKWVIINNSRN